VRLRPPAVFMKILSYLCFVGAVFSAWAALSCWAHLGRLHSIFVFATEQRRMGNKIAAGDDLRSLGADLLLFVAGFAAMGVLLLATAVCLRTRSRGDGDRHNIETCNQGDE